MLHRRAALLDRQGVFISERLALALLRRAAAEARTQRILNTIAVLVPMLRIAPVTAPSRPARIEPTPMMVPVPIITPSTVRNERTLFSRNGGERQADDFDSSRFMRSGLSARKATIGSRRAARRAG